MIRLLLLCLLLSAVAMPQPARQAVTPQQQYFNLPLHFEAASPGHFSSRGEGFSIYIEGGSAAILLRRQNTQETVRLQMQLAGANPKSAALGEKQLPGTVNYLRGNDPRKWRRDVPTFAHVRVPSVLPGVDLLYYGSQRQLEYDLIVAPGVAASSLAWEFSGADSLALDADGSLRANTPAGPVSWRKPVVYQQKGKQRVAVDASYRIVSATRAGFTIGVYDKSLPLVIDPVLDYSTLLGRTVESRATAIAVDPEGNSYIVGYTVSEDFPQVNPVQAGIRGGFDAFVTKLNSTGTAILFSTYLGGIGPDFAYGVALDSASPPNVYVAGKTTSFDFPTVAAAQPSFGGGISDAFLAKLSSHGNTLLYSSYHGGSSSDVGRGVAVSRIDGSAFLAGSTTSDDLPVANAIQPSYGQNGDAFLARFSPAGGTRIFSTFAGGSSNDEAHAVAVDGSGNVCIAGETSSTAFPNGGAFQTAHGGGSDAFVMKFSGSGATRIFSHVVGGNQADGARGIALDTSNAIYLTGRTASPNFPVRSAIQPTFGGVEDAFVAKLSPGGDAVVYSTFLGGPRRDSGAAIAVDPAGRAHVVGSTSGRLATVNAIVPEVTGGGDSILRSSDNGASFVASDSGAQAWAKEAFGESRALISYETAQIAYTISDDLELFRSADGGSTWTRLADLRVLTSGMFVRGLHARAPGDVWVLTESDVLRSIDGGNTWVTRNSGLSGGNLFALAFHPSNTDVVYLADNGGGVYRTANGGAAWAPVNSGLTSLNVVGIYVNPSNPTELLASSFGRNFRSTNSGGFWSQLGGLQPSYLANISKHPVTGELFAMSNYFDPAVSTDDGQNWTLLPRSPVSGLTSFAVDPGDARHLLYGSSYSGIWRSLDRGLTWEHTGGVNRNIRHLAFAPGNSGRVLASLDTFVDTFVARLEPAGSTFTYLTYLGSRSPDDVGGVAADSSGNTYVNGSAGYPMFPTTDGAVQRTTDTRAVFAVKISSTNPPCVTQVPDSERSLMPYWTQWTEFFPVAAPSGCIWSATSSAPWLRVFNGTNRTGSETFGYTAEANSGVANRSADLTVGNRTIRIEQTGSRCASLTSPFDFSSRAFPAEGGTRSALLAVPAGCPWRTYHTARWLTVTPSSGTGPTNVSVSVAPNYGSSSRSNADLLGPTFLSVTQLGGCLVTFSSPAAFLPATAATGQVNLITGSGCPWSLTVTDSYLTLTAASAGTGPALVTYSLSANSNGASRTAAITLPGFQRHLVTQSGVTCAAPILPLNARTISAASTSLPVDVSGTTGCGYTVSSPVPWATIDASYPRILPASATFGIDANPGPASRTTTLTVAGLPFTLTQLAPSSCTLGLTPSITAAPSAGSSGTLAIGATSAACSWTVASSAPWLRLTGTVTGTGNGVLAFIADANPSPTGRAATLSVNGQSVAIVQPGAAPCQSSGFSLLQVTESLTAAAAVRTIPLNAPAGCPWTASSADPWVTVTPAGSGSSPVAMNVQSNPGASPRSTTLTIAGLPFIVQQSAAANLASCTLAATPLPARSEGRTELLGDLLLACANIPLNVLADVHVTLNTTITSPAAAPALTVNTGAALASQPAGYNSLRWPGVRIPAGNSVLRISNVRADASLLATPASFAPVPVNATITLSSATAIPVLNSTVIAATATPGLVLQVGAPSLSGQYRILPVVLSEGFPAAFKTGTPENTRLRITLPNLPVGVRVFAPVFPTEGSRLAQLVSADENGLGGAPIGGSPINGAFYQEISAPATWQLAVSDANANETLSFPLLVQNASDSQFSALLSSLQAALAPRSTVAVSRPGAPLPRFRDLSRPERLTNLRITSSIIADPSAGPSSKAGPIRGLFAVNTPIRITVNVTNETEQVATNTVVRNDLPTGVLFRSCSTGCVESRGQVTWPIGSMAPGETRTMLINATVGALLSQGGAVSNVATVESDEPPASIANSASFASLDLVPGPPSVALPEPISGTGLTKTFVLQFSNPNGYQRLGVLNALINTALDGGNACYIAYSVPAGALFLVNDRGVGDGLSAPLVLGSSNSVSNSQCTINGLRSSVAGSGNDLTLTLEITFRSSFAGNKVVYLAARDEQERNSGWTVSGVHQVPGGASAFPQGQMAPATGVTASSVVSFVYEDQTSNGNLQTLWALGNSSLDGRGACYIVYFAPGNLIGVVPDNGDGGALALIPLSGSGTSGNSQCQIDNAGSSVVRSGNRLTLNLNLTFKPAFSGNRLFWLAGQTVAGQVSPWKASGAWQVPP